MSVSNEKTTENKKVFLVGIILHKKRGMLNRAEQKIKKNK